VQKKAQEGLEDRIVAKVVQRLAEKTPQRKPSNALTTDRLLVIVSGLFSFVVTIVAIQEAHPFWLNAMFYLAALVGVIIAVWKWERIDTWRWSRKLGGVGACAVIYLSIVAFPVWHQCQREIRIRISFKDSPSFTWYRKQKITHDISAFNKYLADLDINTGSEISPITTNQSVGPGFHSPADKPTYRGELVLVS
jgi:hypothetical protein